jgi:hypothetical protein
MRMAGLYILAWLSSPPPRRGRRRGARGKLISAAARGERQSLFPGHTLYRPCRVCPRGLAIPQATRRCHCTATRHPPSTRFPSSAKVANPSSYSLSSSLSQITKSPRMTPLQDRQSATGPRTPCGVTQRQLTHTNLFAQSNHLRLVVILSQHTI